MILGNESVTNEPHPSQTLLVKEETSKNPRVLVIEDEGGLRRLLRYCLQRSGYEVLEAITGEEGIETASRTETDAVLLDTSLPDMNGLRVLGRLREWTQVPVLILSENANENEKVTALDGGANDYITKPFGTAELLARLRVTQRYAKLSQQARVFCSGDLSVDLTNRTVKVKGKQTKLTPTEYSLLRLFIQHAGKVLTHRQIFREVWGPAETDKVEYIRVYLASLRNKLARELIVTEPGIGYRLALQE
jgi:two-component system KDP operon response regulator KdpE